jgi:hypothetical protein
MEAGDLIFELFWWVHVNIFFLSKKPVHVAWKCSYKNTIYMCYCLAVPPRIHMRAACHCIKCLALAVP